MKAINVLRLFSSAQLHAFHQYINCKLFNNSQILCKLFEAFVDIKLYRIKSKGIDPEKLWKSAVGNKQFNDVKFRRIISDLSALIEAFLAFEKYQNNPLETENNTMLAYYEMGLDKYFTQAERLAQEIIEKHPLRNDEFYLNLYRFKFLSNSFQIKQLHRKSTIEYAEADESLNTFYIINKLKMYCEMLNSQSVINVQYKLSQIDEIIKLVEEKSYLNIPAIHIYYLIAKTFLNTDKPYFYELKTVLQKNIRLFSLSEGKVFYSYLFNYCIRKINKGDLIFLTELFGLYQITLENKLIFEDGWLSPWDYKNMVVTALRLKEFEWTENFINNYKNTLPIKHRINAYTYNYSRLLFEKREYKNVLTMLQGVEFDDIFYSLDARALLIKTYYEMQDWITIDYVFNSFSQFLRRDKFIAENHRTNYSNFIKFTRLFCKLQLDKSKITDQILKDLYETPQIADKNWLLEKAKLLI